MHSFARPLAALGENSQPPGRRRRANSARLACSRAFLGPSARPPSRFLPAGRSSRVESSCVSCTCCRCSCARAHTHTRARTQTGRASRVREPSESLARSWTPSGRSAGSLSDGQQLAALSRRGHLITDIAVTLYQPIRARSRYKVDPNLNLILDPNRNLFSSSAGRVRSTLRAANSTWLGWRHTRTTRVAIAAARLAGTATWKLCVLFNGPGEQSGNKAVESPGGLRAEKPRSQEQAGSVKRLLISWSEKVQFWNQKIEPK